MARPEKPLPDGSAPEIDAARWMRGLRDRAGMTNRQIAQFLGMSESTVSRAMAGQGSRRLHDLVFAMTFMCDGSAEEGRDLMGRLARRRRAHLRQPIEGILGCDPDLIVTPSELVRGMRVLRIQAGQPSLAELKRRSPDRALAPTTINEVLLGQRFPSALVLARFVAACGVAPPESDRWARAWQRVMFEQQQSGWRSKAPFARMIRFRLVAMESEVGAAFVEPFREAHETSTVTSLVTSKPDWSGYETGWPFRVDGHDSLQPRRPDDSSTRPGDVIAAGPTAPAYSSARAPRPLPLRAEDVVQSR